jgi:RNA polymerase subunit RPABC4/transcription elongation factor Spt4
MSSDTLIGCPGCGSTQLTSNKKGFSVAKAAGGAILLGGVGILAGAMGSNKIVITCLACGKKFKAGEGKITTVAPNATPLNSTLPHAVKQSNTNNRIVCSDCKTINFSNHTFCKNCKRALTEHDERSDSTNIIPVFACSTCKELAPKDGKFCPHCLSPIEDKKAGCFIATACYGSYCAPEVMILRRFRDNVLCKINIGRAGIACYYLVSPPLAKRIAKSEFLKLCIRRFVIMPIIALIQLRMQKGNG